MQLQYYSAIIEDILEKQHHISSLMMNDRRQWMKLSFINFNM